MKTRIGIFLLIFSFLGCGGSKSKKNEQEIISLEVSIEPSKPQFFDGRPSLNGDGTKLVFLSGLGGVGKLRSYKFSPGVDTQPAFLTAGENGEELDAVLSPLGNFVAVKTFKEGVYSLRVQSFADSSNSREVSLAADDFLQVEGVKVAFSLGDSPLLAVIAQGQKLDGSSLRKLFVVEFLKDGALIATPTVVSIAEGVNSLLAWQPRDSGFQLYHGKNEGVIESVQFTSFAAIDTLTTESIKIGHKGVGNLVTSTEGFYFLRETLLKEKVERKKKPLGKVGQATEDVFVHPQNVIEKKSAEAITLDSPAYFTVKYQVSQSGTSSISLANYYVICEKVKFFGNALTVTTPTFNGTLFVGTDDVGKPNELFIGDPCERINSNLPVDKKQPIDILLSDISFAKNKSEPEDFTVAIESWYRGDHDVFVANFKMAAEGIVSQSIVLVSENSAP